jgi:hypothetical protein
VYLGKNVTNENIGERMSQTKILGKKCHKREYKGKNVTNENIGESSHKRKYRGKLAQTRIMGKAHTNRENWEIPKKEKNPLNVVVQ